MLQKCDPLAKGPYFRVEDNSYKLCWECVEICHVKFLLPLDNTHHATNYRVKSKSQM